MKNKRDDVLCFIGQGWVSKCSLFSVLKTQFPCASPLLLLLGNPTPIPSIYMHTPLLARSLRLQAFSQWGVDDLFPEVFPFQKMRFDVRSVSFYKHSLCSRRWSRCPPMLPLVVSLFLLRGFTLHLILPSGYYFDLRIYECFQFVLRLCHHFHHVYVAT